MTDLGMPDMRGDALAERIRHRCPSMPIVILTGHYDNDALDGDWTVLTKPVGLTALDAAIGREFVDLTPR